MTLKSVLDTLDAVPEAQKELYTKDEESGKFVLDVEIEQHPGARSLKTALGREREAREKSEKTVGELKTSITDLQKQIELKGDKGGDTTDLEKRLKKREEELRAEFAPTLQKLADLTAKDAKRSRLDQIRAAAKDAKLLPDRYDDALLAADQFLGDKDGKVIVLDADGDPSSVTLEKFFKEVLREKKPWFYEGAAGSGSGARGDTVAGGRGVRTIAADDQKSKSASIDDIASGKVVVK